MPRRIQGDFPPPPSFRCGLSARSRTIPPRASSSMQQRLCRPNTPTPNSFPLQRWVSIAVGQLGIKSQPTALLHPWMGEPAADGFHATTGPSDVKKSNVSAVSEGGKLWWASRSRLAWTLRGPIRGSRARGVQTLQVHACGLPRPRCRGQLKYGAGPKPRWRWKQLRSLRACDH